MKHAYVFPGQGAQFPGMGKTHYENSSFAKRIFEQANEILEFRISDVMFDGSEEDLRQTNITQPAIFLHSIIAYKSIENARPDMVAGHSLGEFSALVANGTLSFEDGLQLVSLRALAMQKACEMTPSTMAAVLGLADEKVEEICKQVSNETGEVVVPANYNCPGQLVISGRREESTDRKDKNYHYVERAVGSFVRAVTLPGEVDSDKIDAQYENGVLNIKLPKSAKAQPKKIEIRSK